MLASVVVDSGCELRSGQAKKIKLVFAAILLNIQYKEVRPMTGWLSFMIMCMS